MALVESAGQSYFHGSKKKFPNGFVLAAQKRGYAHSTGLKGEEAQAHRLCEQKLEEYRARYSDYPVPRAASTFMVADADHVLDAGGYDNFVYEVEPSAPVARCNLYWYGVLEGLCFQVGEELDEFEYQEAAKGYWKALPNDLGEPRRDLYEYLAQSARVIRRVK